LRSVEGVPFRCSAAAEERGDPLEGTAAPAPRWLLIEQPGPWGGRDALRQSGLDPAVGDALSRRTATAAGIRPMLIRRPGRAVPRDRRRWAYVDSRPGHEEVRWGEFGLEAELLELPLDGSAGTASTEPVYLVCTHGRHDPCCALRGRPVAEALAAVRPEQTWECSHVGGDRFAANLVLLPHGLYYARVTAPTVERFVAAYEQGRLVEPWLRGRAGHPAPVQAAAHHARLALGEDRIGALPVRRVDQRDEHTWQVVFGHERGEVAVTVRAGHAREPARLTCTSRYEETPRVFGLVDLRLPA
jgi:hypothetical protein